MVKKLKLQERRAVIPSRRSLTACHPLRHVSLLESQIRRPWCPRERRGAISRPSRPLVRKDEPWAIQKDTNIVVHPTYVHNNIMSWVFYLIEASGPGERLYQFPEGIVEVG
jgi:hypothetical protein